MKSTLSAVCFVIVLTPAFARAETPAEVKAVLDKAIKAHGYAEAPGKLPAVITKMKGKWYGMGDGIEYTGVFMVHAPNQLRFEITMQIGGQDFTVIQATKGDKGWMSFAGMAMDMTKEAVAEAHESLHLHEVALIAPLKGKEYKLSLLGASKVDDRPVLGVHVERTGKRDINLFFDKDNGLLVKTEMRAKDPMAGDQEFTQTTIYRDFKKVDKTKVAHKVEIRRDDKLYVDGEVTEVQHPEKLDDASFTKP